MESDALETQLNNIVEPVLWAKTTVQYKKPQGPHKEACWGGG